MHRGSLDRVVSLVPKAHMVYSSGDICLVSLRLCECLDNSSITNLSHPSPAERVMHLDLTLAQFAQALRSGPRRDVEWAG